MKRVLWTILGFIFLGIAYIGLVTPGIPWSTPTVIAAYCFAKSNKKWHDWIMNHRLFGPFLKDWSSKRVFPFYGKLAMVITMDVSLLIVWFTTNNWQLVGMLAAGMLLCAIWAWRYPSSAEEYERRKLEGKRIGWFK